MHLGIRLVWLALLALQAFALGTAPALSATKVSFGQVSPTATVWPGVVAAKKGFFAANGVEMDTVSIGVSPGMQAVASGSLNIMHNTCNAVISFIESGGKGVHLSLVSVGIHPGVVVGKKGLKSASELKGKVVLDAGNPYPSRDGDMAVRDRQRGTGVSSAEYLPGTRLVRAFNAINSGPLERDAFRKPERLGIPLAADDPEAMKVAEQLVRDAGFDPVPVGKLSRAREFDYGTPVYVRGMTAAELRQKLGLK